MKGFKLVIKSDKCIPICGNVLVKPSAKEPTIFPTKEPIAVPISPRTRDPSPIIHSNPGICANPPKAVNITAIPPTNIPKSAIAVIAPDIGIVLNSFAVTPRATNTPAIDSNEDKILSALP